jgi:hypothetical protein
VSLDDTTGRLADAAEDRILELVGTAGGTPGGLTSAQQARLAHAPFQSIFNTSTGAYAPPRPAASVVPAGYWVAIGGTQAAFQTSMLEADQWVNA